MNDTPKTRVVAGDPIPVGQYVLDELEARGWSTALAASMFAPDGQIDEWHLWLELLTTIEIWQDSDVRFGESEAERLEAIFGVNKHVWLNMHIAYVEKRKARRN